MAIPTVFDIIFGCGHAGTVDAADRAADQRDPWISYLSSTGMCPEGFEATHDKRRELARTQWIAERRKDEEVAIGAWEGEAAAMTLTGSVTPRSWPPTISTRSAPWSVRGGGGWLPDSDDLWDVVRSWPAVADGAIPVVTAR